MDFTKLKALANNYKDSNMDAFLIQLVECVEEYTQKSIREISGQIFDERVNKVSLGNVYTLLSDELDDIKMKNNGWYAFDDDICVSERIRDKDQIDNIVKRIKQLREDAQNDHPRLGHVYFVCEREKYKSIVNDGIRYEGKMIGKSGEKYGFEYSFQFADMVLNKEKDLSKCAGFYSAKTPVIFNPMGRRAAYIYILNESVEEHIPEDIEEIDLCYKENGLSNLIAGTGRLYWNVRIQEQYENFSQITDKAGEENRFVYTFDGCNEGSYIIPMLRGELISAENYKRENKKIILRFREKYMGSFVKLDIIPDPVIPKDNRSYVFSNESKMNSSVKERVRSKADVIYVMNQIGSQLGIRFKKVTKDELPDYHMAEGYDQERRYKNYDSLRINEMQKLYLWFTNDESTPFVEDYINYICDYMTGMYPDFRWKGGYR